MIGPFDYDRCRFRFARKAEYSNLLDDSEQSGTRLLTHGISFGVPIYGEEVLTVDYLLSESWRL